LNFHNTTVPQIKIEGVVYSPILYRPVKNHEVNGTNYLPAHIVKPERIDKSRTIDALVNKNVTVLKFNNITYIPT